MDPFFVSSKQRDVFNRITKSKKGYTQTQKMWHRDNPHLATLSDDKCNFKESEMSDLSEKYSGRPQIMVCNWNGWNKIDAWLP